MIREIVFLLNSSFPYYTGGRENWLCYIGNGLVNRGYKVSIISVKPSTRDKKKYVLDDRINIQNIWSFYSCDFTRLFVRKYIRFFDHFFISHQIKRHIQRNYCVADSERIFITLDTVFLPFGLELAKKRIEEVNYICASKGPHFELLEEQYPLLSKMISRMEEAALNSTVEIWTNGYDMQEYFSNRGRKSYFIGNGVDTKGMDEKLPEPNEYKPYKNQFKIVSIGTLLDIKGVKELISAAKILKEQGNDNFIVLFVGKGNIEKYSSFAAQIGVADLVSFVGERTSIFKYYKHADVITCLSGGGGLSMSALEALASKKPVIAWDTKVYQQMIKNNQNGLLVKYQSSGNLADGIVRVMNMKNDDIKELGKKGREKAEEFSWDSILNNIEQRLRYIQS
jgi:glycosyltransferase involved in cell wall biosynthesis